MGSNHLNNQFGSKESEQYEKYFNNPSLFARQQWIGYNVGTFKIAKIQPHGYQLKVIDSIHKNKFNTIASARQMGGSSIMAVYIAWYVLYNRNKKILIMSNNLEAGKRILELVKTILFHYSVNSVFNYSFNINKDSKTELELDNGCNIKVCVATADAGKGDVLDLLFIDNAAFIKKLGDIYMGLGMSISSGDGKVVLMSTPYDDSDFNLLALNSRDNKDINSIELTWKHNPKWDDNWYEQQCLMWNHNQNRIDTELNCIINYKEKSSKDKTISLRIDSDTYNKMKIKAGGLQISDYLRYLIDHDLS